ncbi:conserved hypothetical protein [Altererythrobacter sp. B11]|uniref:hypothetical protein n=1 Tax=Altererythrobacter sp. B11 TaxID=2060312 RepID=UPI000DC6E3DE|nr:hypothetical protein [Altererythrobacter sp. B11]BBC71408.1 conserved hypothetical protein [Altererythrobacter sp. B11]
MTRLAVALFALSAAVGLGASPASAQEAAGDRVNTVIIYGDDECPKSTEGEITVCARLDETERYRIPERLRQSDDPANEAWSQKVLAYETVGDFGPLSCTTIGAGGELGCTAQMIEAAYAEKRAGSNVRFSELIAQARAERLSTINEEAADTQSRVEEIERQYAERQRAAQEGDDSQAPRPADETPRVVDPAKLAQPPQN